jgi:hypothetical protein
MNYTVLWPNRQQRQLTAICVRARQQGHDTAAITAAVNELDTLLGHNPATRGESRAASERVLFALPLSVHFEVHEDEQVVLILSVRYHVHD